MDIIIDDIDRLFIKEITEAFSICSSINLKEIYKSNNTSEIVDNGYGIDFYIHKYAIITDTYIDYEDNILFELIMNIENKYDTILKLVEGTFVKEIFEGDGYKRIK